MRNLVIAPTSTYKRGPLRWEVGDNLRDSKEAINLEQRVTSIVPESTDKTDSIVDQKIYKDMTEINKLHKNNRERDLEVYERDSLYARRPMANVAFPEMKLRSLIDRWK